MISLKQKQNLALEINGNYPSIADKAIVDLKDAYHPLLFLYNKQSGRKTIPVSLKLDEKNRILLSVAQMPVAKLLP